MDSISNPIRTKLAHFSGHETFPLRQMWLKKVFDQATNGEILRKSAFSDEKAIAHFGIGKNMVASIRHWALACGVMYEDGCPRAFKIDHLGVRTFSWTGLRR